MASLYFRFCRVILEIWLTSAFFYIHRVQIDHFGIECFYFQSILQTCVISNNFRRHGEGGSSGIVMTSLIDQVTCGLTILAFKTFVYKPILQACVTSNKFSNPWVGQLESTYMCSHYIAKQQYITLTISALKFWLFSQEYLQACATSNNCLKTWVLGPRPDNNLTY